MLANHTDTKPQYLSFIHIMQLYIHVHLYLKYLHLYIPLLQLTHSRRKMTKTPIPSSLFLVVAVTVILSAAAAAAAAAAVELTKDNYDELTAGKTVFIKFFAPWCGHCSKMKPDWDRLASHYHTSKSTNLDVLIADVDCTGSGESLCNDLNIEGFPTLQWGHGPTTTNLQNYDGERDYESLMAFAKTNLKPQCSPKRMELCDQYQRKDIEKYQNMNVKELQKRIQEKEKEIAKLEEDFETFMEDLQKQYQERMELVQQEKKHVKQSGLGLMRAVRASLVQQEKESNKNKESSDEL